MSKCKISGKKLVSLVLGLLTLSGVFAMMVNAENYYYLVDLENDFVTKMSGCGRKIASIKIGDWDRKGKILQDYVCILVSKGERVYIDVGLLDIVKRSQIDKLSDDDYDVALGLAELLLNPTMCMHISFYTSPERNIELKNKLIKLAKHLRTHF